MALLIASSVGFQTLSIVTCLEDSGGLTPALVSVRRADGSPAIDRDERLKRGPIPSDGRLALSLPPGEYKVTASKGFGYEFVEKRIVLDKDSEISLALTPWFDFHKAGLFTGDCHNHLNYPVEPQEATTYMEAHGVDMLSLCQGWMSSRSSARQSDGQRLAEFLEGASTRNARLFFGAEYPKTRFGHAGWWKFPVISDPIGCYDSYHDGSYFKKAGISKEPMDSPSTQFPYPSEPPINKVLRWRRLGGVSMALHPTSWWVEEKEATLICTNIAVDYCFSLLAGDIYDTLVVMGYDPEQIFYQNLWFHLLNQGYRIAGAAETDGDMKSHHRIGSIRPYAYCSGTEFDRGEFLRALRAGNSFVTSGPILLATADGKALPGSIARNDGRRHRIQAIVKSHPNPEEYISWLVLYRNGEPVELVDIEERKLRSYEHVFEFDLDPAKREWFVVKAYGKDRPERKEFVDVMRYSALCETEEHYEYTKLGQVAFTNPFYFEPDGFAPPSFARPPLRGIVRSASGTPLEKVEVRLSEDGIRIASTFTDADGNYGFPSVSLLSEIELAHPGYKKSVRNIYLDYPPLRRYFESIYSGEWRKKSPALKPGQVPWSAFDFDGLRKILSTLSWDLTLSPKQ